MLETIRSLLLDFQETPRETGVPRRLRIETLEGKATVLIGVRRSGKSTFLFQIVERLLASGVPRQNILYLNFFDDRLRSLSEKGLGAITEAYYSPYPEKKDTETVHCFFDEIQVIEGWEPFIDRLMRTENCQVYLTGSSSRMLSKEIATEMRGRAVSWEVFPFSFREFLDHEGVEVEGALSTRKQFLVRKAFQTYWETGGFPEVVSTSRQLRVKIHQEYLQAILFRDLIERHDVSHPRAMVDLAHRLLDDTGSLYSVNSLTGHLKALGHKVPKSTVSEWLEWFEDAYFLFTVRIFDASKARRDTNPKRVYAIDHALVASVSAGILVNSGHLLENLVFMALRRLGHPIHYYRTRAGREVDFLVTERGQPPRLVQVSESLARPETRQREVLALDEAMAELGLDSAMLVTRDEEERVEARSGIIEVIPAWRFLLGLPESAAQ